MQFNLFLAYNAVDPAPIGPKTLYIPSVLLHCTIVQRSAKVGAPGLVNFVTVVAYHFCPRLSAPFTQPGALTLADLCKTGTDNVDCRCQCLTCSAFYARHSCWMKGTKPIRSKLSLSWRRHEHLTYTEAKGRCSGKLREFGTVCRSVKLPTRGRGTKLGRYIRISSGGNILRKSYRL